MFCRFRPSVRTEFQLTRNKGPRKSVNFERRPSKRYSRRPSFKKGLSFAIILCDQIYLTNITKLENQSCKLPNIKITSRTVGPPHARPITTDQPFSRYVPTSGPAAPPTRQSYSKQEPVPAARVTQR